MEVRKVDFVQWKNDPITKEVFKVLQEMKERVQEAMIGRNLVADPNGHLKLNELMGYTTAIDDVLTIDIEESNDEESS